MKEVEFQKFTSYGNNFIIVDETQNLKLREDEKSQFACQVTDVNFGVGADGVLFLQPYRSDVLADIKAVHGYWDRLPVFSHVDFMFRIFEPDGSESYSCGNGLMCLASYLNRQYGIESAQILTQIPTRQPKVITIGTNADNGTTWAKMGTPSHIPQKIVNPSSATIVNEDIQFLDDLTIHFRTGDLHPFSSESNLKLGGYLVYTGEPHLVLFPETGFSIPEIGKVMFISSQQRYTAEGLFERRIQFGSWLINHIGTYLNRHYTHVFPKGINVNFVVLPTKSNVLEYRCFERGIDRETLACGTGALAVSFVARQLQHVTAQQIIVWPHRSRWYDPEASILVDEGKDGWSLYGSPIMLLDGKFKFESFLAEQITSLHAESSNHDQIEQSSEDQPYQLANQSY